MSLAINWTQELENSILSHIESGSTLRQAAEKEGISDSAIIRHAKDSEAFEKQYARALEVRAERDFEQLEDEVTEAPAMISTKFGEMIDPAWVQLQRLKVDTRKWALSKRNPKVYGDKQQVEMSGSLELAESIAQARKRVK